MPKFQKHVILFGMKTFIVIISLVWSTCLSARDIVLWHAFDGFLEEKFCEIIEDFNHHSGTYRIVPIRKGNYAEVYEQGVDSIREGNRPHILQVYEVATLTMMLQEDCYVPVEELMSKYHRRFDPDVYIDSVRKFYSAPNGKMLSLPWNASTGILFYNKEAFKEAGLDPEHAPKTWPELEFMGKKLTQKGYKGFTTAWPAAYHLEHLCSWHDLPFGSHSNGFGGLEARLIFNQDPQVFHLSKLVEWQESGIFSYSGRFTEEPERRFAGGECAILLQGANRLPLIQRKSSFNVGVGFMPYWPHLTEKPHTLNIGGASFWVMQGFSDEEYRGIVQFFEYLSTTEVQAYWHQETGYLPITDAAYYLTKKKGFYRNHPAAEIAVLEVMQGHPSENSYGVRFGNYIDVREVIMDNLERAFRGESTAQEALNRAVKDGNEILEKFQKEHDQGST